MKKYKVSGIFTEYIYAKNEDEAREQFDEIASEYAKSVFDVVEVEEDLDYGKEIEYTFVPQ